MPQSHVGCLSFIVPGQELVDPGLLVVVDDGGEGCCQPGLGFDVVQFAGFN